MTCDYCEREKPDAERREFPLVLSAFPDIQDIDINLCHICKENIDYFVKTAPSIGMDIIIEIGRVRLKEGIK